MAIDLEFFSFQMPIYLFCTLIYSMKYSSSTNFVCVENYQLIKLHQSERC